MARYARYRRDGGEHVGVVVGEAIAPLVGAAGEMVRDLMQVIESSNAVLTPSEADASPLAHVDLLAPHAFPPRNVMCVGKNYRAHVAEFAGSGYDTSDAGGRSDDDPLIVFTKTASSIVGPNATISVPSGLTAEVDYEGELAVIVGTGGRAIAPADAWSHVFGYTIVNDVTARDLQKRHRQWFLGKSIDTFCPMGPVVVTADEVDGADVTLRTWVNGELRQHASTTDLIHDIPSIISTISATTALVPGDVIATGTPAGVGIGFNPPRLLADGDLVTIEIDGIGRLVNRVAFTSRA